MDKTENQIKEPTIIDDSTLHPGVASAWVVGRRILADGNVEEALTYLNYAYHILPDVVIIALDYQDALARGGFVQDAVKVMDQLITAHPDSLQWRVRRSGLNLRLGKSRKALDDLAILRDKGHSSAQLLETEALILSSKGKNKRAMEVYRSGLDTFPEHAAAMYMGMIQIEQQSGDVSGILKLCDEAIAQVPSEPVFRDLEMRALVSQGNHRQALLAAHKADAQQYPPGMVTDPFLLQLADIYVQGGQVDRAIEILSAEDDANGLELKSSLWLARLLLGSNQTEEATVLVDRIEGKWADSSRLWFLKGKLAEEKGEWDLAVQHFETAVALDPEDPEILLALVRALLVSNDVELADAGFIHNNPQLFESLTKYADAASARAANADAEGQLILGYAYRALLDFDQSIVHFKLSARDTDYQKAAMTQASICYDELDNTEKALEVLQVLFSALPNDPEVANSLGYFLAEKNMDIKKAEKLIDFALKKEPGRGAYLDSKGWVLYRKGNLDSAFDYLIRAVNAMPDDPIILEHMGIVLYEQKQFDQALDVLRRALQAGGDTESLGHLIQKIEKRVSANGN